MCGIAAAGLVLALASTAYTVEEQNKNTKTQNAYNQKAADEGAALADASFKSQSGEIRLRQQEDAAGASQELLRNAKAAAGARATARVSAGESGASGVSVDNLITDFYSQEAQFQNSTNQNRSMADLQANQELMGIRSGAIGQAIGSRRPMINPPSYLAAGIQGAGQVLDTYSRYRYTTSTSSGRTNG